MMTIWTYAAISRRGANRALGCAPVIYFTGEGEGVWGGDTEDAYTIIFEKPVGVEILELKQGLSNLARRYNQEAIAWTEGLTQLLG